eukprot:CAMPEP_0194269972 /NCGR_PEP_ID=MMETSP0169-20130528/4053_1 /TAXON_ID=218684 /ORGANISM="Corethron pennatum, Strain L29A3" /LENGTH=274 /DNA_ID=CAMNT_0039011843 /DNA_START=299 /DNA_END=1119 /DNA_ORIENTATION=-
MTGTLARIPASSFLIGPASPASDAYFEKSPSEAEARFLSSAGPASSVRRRFPSGGGHNSASSAEIISATTASCTASPNSVAAAIASSTPPSGRGRGSEGVLSTDTAVDNFLLFFVRFPFLTGGGGAASVKTAAHSPSVLSVLSDGASPGAPAEEADRFLRRFPFFLADGAGASPPPPAAVPTDGPVSACAIFAVRLFVRFFPPFAGVSVSVTDPEPVAPVVPPRPEMPKRRVNGPAVHLAAQVCVSDKIDRRVRSAAAVVAEETLILGNGGVVV